MIQRIQSVFLVLVSASLILFIILPVWIKVDPETGNFYKVFSLYFIQLSEKNPDPTYTYFPYLISGVLAVMAIFLSVIELFSYKNRMNQLKIGIATSLLILIALGVIIYLAYQNQQTIMPEIAGNYQPGLFMPACALIFNSLANRFIRKDESLIRSVDRIR